MHKCFKLLRKCPIEASVVLNRVKVVLMSMAQLSPNSIIANPAHINPQVKVEQSVAVPKVNQEVQQTVQAIKTDTITFSQQAAKRVVNDVHSSIQELKDRATEVAVIPFLIHECTYDPWPIYNGVHSLSIAFHLE